MEAGAGGPGATGGHADVPVPSNQGARPSMDMLDRRRPLSPVDHP